MNRLNTARRATILGMLVEGSSLRSISRVTGVSINTVTKLLIDAGRACIDYHDVHVRGVKSERVQVDEIWEFIYAKCRRTSVAPIWICIRRNPLRPDCTPIRAYRVLSSSRRIGFPFWPFMVAAASTAAAQPLQGNLC